jgi:hypothetical protein
MKRILSCGAGVQSSTILIMSCIGELPKLDAAVFADTGWEPMAVYDHLRWLKGFSEDHGIPFHIVGGDRNIRDDNIIATIGSTRKKGERWGALPLYTKAPHEESEGQVKRQCTSEYKIQPIERFLRREVMGLKPRQHAPKVPTIEHWFGITADEIRRCRMSPHPWAINRYPLIEDFDPPMRRLDCLKWYNGREFPRPPRSACIGCPYHTNAEWRRMKEEAPEEWADAVEFDHAIRNQGGAERPCYLHRSCVPLDEVDLSTEEERGQGMLFECSGMCGT